MSFKGPQARLDTQNAVPTESGAHKRRCLHNSVHKKRRSVATAGVMLFKGPWTGGTHRTRWLHQAVHTKGGQ